MKELVNSTERGLLQATRKVFWDKADLLQPKDWKISRFPVHLDGREIGGVLGQNQLPSRLPIGAHMNDATAMLAAIRSGDADATEQLLILVYDELRRLAAAKLAGEAAGQTLQPTALVHEAWLRLVGDHSRSFKDREHFFRASAEAMRRILIDRARRKRTQRHGGAYHRVELEDFDPAAPTADDQLLAVNDALDKFALEHPEHAELVKLKYFAGLTNEEVGEVLGISLSTVKNYWAFSRAWLLNEIGR